MPFREEKSTDIGHMERLSLSILVMLVCTLINSNYNIYLPAHGGDCATILRTTRAVSIHVGFW